MPYIGPPETAEVNSVSLPVVARASSPPRKNVLRQPSHALPTRMSLPLSLPRRGRTEADRGMATFRAFVAGLSMLGLSLLGLSSVPLRSFAETVAPAVPLPVVPLWEKGAPGFE